MLPGTFDEWLEREYLLTNGRGGFACSTIIGCPTRREHGWMIWNVPGPRLERWMLWSHASESLQLDGRTTLLANFEFNNAVDPHGYRHLAGVELSLDEQRPSISWTYKLDNATIVRSLTLVHGEDVLLVRYAVRARPEADIRLQVWPMIAARPIGELRRKTTGEMFQMSSEGAAVGLRYKLDPRISFGLLARRVDGGPDVQFTARGDWWYNFRYRRESERGYDSAEDLMVPGAFVASGKGELQFEIAGVGGTHDLREMSRRVRLLDTRPPSESSPTVVRFNGNVSHDPSLPEPPQLLRYLARQFIFRQYHANGSSRIGLTAGYPWLEEYSRDACVSVAGLLLENGWTDEARELLLQIALLRRDGALPSLLSDEPHENEYVNADASLWFIRAVDAYLTATDDRGPVVPELLRAGLDIVRALARNERVAMSLDSDGLIICEDASRAATWMDARYAWHFITPRTGKPVEVNALWYHALCVLSRRLVGVDPAAAAECAALAARVRESFPAVFWNPAVRGLYDVVRADGPDPAVRPNQILAVSLPDSPLSPAQQADIVRLVHDELVTPLGLRTLARSDPEYRGRYEGSADAREHAAHQGTVYSWLLGPFIEAYLRVHGDAPEVRAAARAMLEPIIDHLTRSGATLGISELFDADPPHRPRGSITQAWSVAEIIRAWRMTEPPGPAAPSPDRHRTADQRVPGAT